MKGNEEKFPARSSTLKVPTATSSRAFSILSAKNQTN